MLTFTSVDRGIVHSPMSHAIDVLVSLLYGRLLQLLLTIDDMVLQFQFLMMENKEHQSPGVSGLPPDDEELQLDLHWK